MVWVKWYHALWWTQCLRTPVIYSSLLLCYDLDFSSMLIGPIRPSFFFILDYRYFDLFWRHCLFSPYSSLKQLQCKVQLLIHLWLRTSMFKHDTYFSFSGFGHHIQLTYWYHNLDCIVVLCRKSLRSMLRKLRPSLRIQQTKTNSFSMGSTNKPLLGTWTPVSTLITIPLARVPHLFVNCVILLLDSLLHVSWFFGLIHRPSGDIQPEGASKVGCLEGCWR